MSSDSEAQRIHTRFDRHECKYVTTEERACAMREFVAPYVQPDPYAIRTGGRYPISSLYFDSPALKLHRETEEGLMHRYKLRIRAYSDDRGDQAFFEIKRRFNGVISKIRAPVPRALVDRFVREGGISELVDERHRQAVDDYVSRVLQIRARPTVCVRYVREAFVGKFDPRTRITFDRRLECRVTRELKVHATDWISVEPSRVIVEMKFDGHSPAWLVDTVQQFGMRRRSYSKYSRSIKAAQRAGVLSDVDQWWCSG